MKKILILFVLLISSVSLFAGPIGEERARQIAEEFFAVYDTRSTSGEIELEWAGEDINNSKAGNLSNALLYIYNRGTNNGFVVIAGDSNIAPIIAYSFDTTLDVSNMAEATRAILDAWSKQVSMARKAAKPISEGMPSIATRADDKLLYNTALWNQGEPYNREAPVYDGYRSVTGCVATAMSIICYYNKWPEKGVGTTPEYTYEDMSGVYRTVAANKLGRTYNYGNMLMDYNYGYTTDQGNAVAALMKDMGTSVKMQYHYNGSGAIDNNVIAAFITYFSYSKSARLTYRSSYRIDEWNELLRDNLREYGPTYYSGQSNSGGHAFVVDGFENDYFHFNFGWGGYGNGFYLCPDIEYYVDQMALLGLEPDKNGTSTYSDHLMLLPYDDSNSGYKYRGITSTDTEFKQNTTFNILVGTFYNAGVTTFNGDIWLVLTDKSGKVKEYIADLSVTNLEPGFLIWYYQFSATIISAIETGDRLRVYYKGAYSDDWQWMRSRDIDSCYDELVLRPTAEEIADNLQLLYDNSSLNLMYSLPYAHTVTCNGAINASASIASYNTVTLSVSDLTGNDKADEINLTFTIGNESYELLLKF